MISNKVIENMKSGSAIRKMFEEGNRLAGIYGADNVFDFSIGNPDVDPPAAVKESLKKLAALNEPKQHGYMSNAGYADVRERVAQQIGKETGLPVSGNHIVMTVGAGGALNVILKTLLNEGEEIIVLAPFFMEYRFYIDNHGGKSVIVNTQKDSFQPDAEAIRKAITPKTKAILINTPNNPTGVVYTRESLEKIAKVIESREKEFGTTIYVISDEPYRKLVYDGTVATHVFSIFKNSIVGDSFSKTLSLPGERIGYIAANPAIEDIELLMNGLIFCNRTLGFVNAPATFQRVLLDALDSAVDLEMYRKKRDRMYNALISLGYECIKPMGTFYLFPNSPIPDDAEFCSAALKHNLILVPGRSFGMAGYFRIAYCVTMKTIENSIPAFEALIKEYK